MSAEVVSATQSKLSEVMVLASGHPLMQALLTVPLTRARWRAALAEWLPTLPADPDVPDEEATKLQLTIPVVRAGGERVERAVELKGVLLVGLRPAPLARPEVWRCAVNAGLPLMAVDLDGRVVWSLL